MVVEGALRGERVDMADYSRHRGVDPLHTQFRIARYVRRNCLCS